MDKFEISDKTMIKLEDFSVKIEHLKNFAVIVKKFTWNDVYEKHKIESVEKLGSLTEILTDLLCTYEKDLDSIIKEISLKHNSM